MFIKARFSLRRSRVGEVPFELGSAIVTWNPNGVTVLHWGSVNLITCLHFLSDTANRSVFVVGCQNGDRWWLYSSHAKRALLCAVALYYWCTTGQKLISACLAASEGSSPSSAAKTKLLLWICFQVLHWLLDRLLCSLRDLDSIYMNCWNSFVFI